MASGIPGGSNFNTSKVSNYGAKSVPVTPDDSKPVSDSVQLTGSGFATARVTGLAALIADVSPGITPSEMKEVLINTAKDGVLDAPAAQAAAAKRAPVHLSMDEVGGIGSIGDSQQSDKGHGLTGLNSLSSVVATGKFEGLNGSYGADRPFGL